MDRDQRPLQYGALIAMMLMSFLLVTAEFLPGGLITSIADGLGVSSGQAGQMVTVTALGGLLAAPTVGLLFPRLNRRSLLVWLSVVAAVSNIVVAIAPTLPLILLSRFLLGAAIAGFWAMAISVAAVIAGPKRLGRAVMFNSAGVSLATVAGVPLGVLLSDAVGWRGVFVVAATLSAILALGLRFLLPSVPAERAASLAILLEAVRRPGIALGVLANVLVVTGHFLAYTYVRLALERVADGGHTVGPETVVMLLAFFGVGGLIGNLVFGTFVDRAYRVLAVVTPLTIAAFLLLTIGSTASLWSTGAAVFFWGFLFASWLLVANTWVGHRMPDLLEAGGSLIVLGFQAGIMLAAAVGGVIVDGFGIVPVFLIGAVLLVAGGVLFGLSGRRHR